MSQNATLIKMMKRCWVSPLLALSEAGCMRFGARIQEIKEDGVSLEERWTECKKTGKAYKEFRVRRDTALADMARYDKSQQAWRDMQ